MMRFKKWYVDKEALRAGVAWINKECPVCDADNAQYLWVLENISDDSGTPIAGWPESKVLKMAQNITKSQTGAVPNKGFPLQTYSMKDEEDEALGEMRFLGLD